MFATELLSVHRFFAPAATLFLVLLLFWSAILGIFGQILMKFVARFRLFRQHIDFCINNYNVQASSKMKLRLFEKYRPEKIN